MIQPSQSLIVVLASRMLARMIQLFALYVVFHGHYSPGGGFQGGALLAASILLLRMTEGHEGSQAEFASRLGTPLSALGVLIFGGIGMLAWASGGAFLDYGALPFGGAEAAERRSLGILLIELGVALAVMATLVRIFDDLSGGEAADD